MYSNILSFLNLTYAASILKIPFLTYAVRLSFSPACLSKNKNRDRSLLKILELQRAEKNMRLICEIIHD